MTDENKTAVSHTGESLQIKDRGSAGDHQDGLTRTYRRQTGSNPQGEMEQARLEEQLEVALKETRKYTDKGLTVPESVQRRADAISQSLGYQMKQNARVTRGDASREIEDHNATIMQAYETAVEGEVIRTARQHGLSKEAALEIVNQKIAALGVERMFPGYARLVARISKA